MRELSRIGSGLVCFSAALGYCFFWYIGWRFSVIDAFQICENFADMTFSLRKHQGDIPRCSDLLPGGNGPEGE